MPPEEEDVPTTPTPEGEESTTPASDPSSTSTETPTTPAADDATTSDPAGDEGVDPELKNAREMVTSLRNRNAQTGRERASLQTENDQQKARIAELEAAAGNGNDAGTSTEQPQQRRTQRPRNTRTRNRNQNQRGGQRQQRPADNIDRSAPAEATTGDVAYVHDINQLSSDPRQAVRQLWQNDQVQRGAVLETMRDLERERQQLANDRKKMNAMMNRFQKTDADQSRTDELESLRNLGLDDQTAQDIFDLEATGQRDNKRAARTLLLNAAKDAEGRKADRQRQIQDQQRVVGASGSASGAGGGAKGIKSDVTRLGKLNPDAQMEAIGKLVESQGDSYALSVMNALGIDIYE